MRYDEDSGRSKYDNHENGSNNSKDEHEQSSYKYNKYPRNIRRPMIFDSKQYEGLGIQSSMHAS